MRVTAVAALFLQRGRVLSVSRKNDPNDRGLPGGKVDPDDDSPYAAMVREVKEETGLDVVEAKLVFERTDGDHLVQTFRIMKWKGSLTTQETGVVRWDAPCDLLTPACRSFRDYNRSLFERIGLDVT